MQLCMCKLGVDLTLPLTVQQWGALNLDFAVVRVVKHTGEIDYTGIKNLRRAMQANLTDLSGYMYPCISSSYFARVQKINCLSAAGQLEALRNALEINDAGLEPYKTNTWPPTNAPTQHPTILFSPTYAPTVHPTFQPGKTPSAAPTHAPTQFPTSRPTKSPSVFIPNTPTFIPTHLPTHAPTHQPTYLPGVMHPTSVPTNPPNTKPLLLKRIFLMVEDESPPRYFDANQLVNMQYFKELATRAYEYGFQLGVFTTLRYWSELMQTDSGQVVEFSRKHVPLWIPRFDNTQSMDFFLPFGGWTKVYMKQYWGGSSPARRLDVTWRLSQNYIVDHLNDTSIDPL